MSIDQYEIVEYINGGAFGHVYKANRLSDEQVVVIKRVQICRETEQGIKDAYNEIQILQNVQHQYIVKYYDAFMSEEKEGKSVIKRLNIIMEYADGGDLFSKLKEQSRIGIPFQEKIIWKYVYQIAAGLQYLHSNRILRRTCSYIHD